MVVKASGISFDQLVEQNEQRVRYQVYQLRQENLCDEIFYGGVFAKWYAYKKYRPKVGILSTYFHFVTRERLIDDMRKETEPPDD